MITKVGLIGCGRQAPKHISGLVAWGDVEIVAADQDAIRAQKLAADCGVTAAERVDDIFADPEIVAVSICTPPASHAGLIRSAIAAGKHFFCEKPLSPSLSEARELERLAREAGLIGMVGYIYRFAPAFELASEALSGVRSSGHAGALGEVTSAFFRLGGPGSHDVWQHRRDSGGGAVNEMLVHMLDLALWYFGPPVKGRVLAQGIRDKERTIGRSKVVADVEDWIVAEFETARGASVLIEADLVTPTFVQYAEIHGRNGSFMGSIRPDFSTYVECLEEAQGFAAGRTPYAFAARNLYEPQLACFMDSVVGARRLERCTLAQSVELLEALALLDTSAN